MKQEDKELLLKDLCARLPYGVICKYHYRYKGVMSITEKDGQGVLSPRMIKEYDLKENITWTNEGYYSELKPYLRPMSSMTEEEKKEYELLANHCIVTSIGFVHIESQILIDWLNANRFDYRGLIEKGLALEAPKGMYKEE